jgi:formyltetrahydrofolate synthetase
MKISYGHRVVLNVGEEYVIIMTKTPYSLQDPANEYWGVAQGYKVVSFLNTSAASTLVLVPIGEVSRVKRSDFKPEDLETE